MVAEPFANRTTAAAGENHEQGTHVWVSGGTLEIDSDFGIEYDLTTLHF